MIAQYPSFSKLTINLKDDVEAITTRFEPYSDFNFSSLLCWDTDNSTSISSLNGNIVIKLPDYLSGKPVTSILGDKKIDESVELLLKKSKSLKLVPEAVILAMQNKSKFNIKTDDENFDYIYDLKLHTSLEGSDFKGKRKKVNRFIRNFHNRYSVEAIDFKKHETKSLIFEAFDAWAAAKNRQGKDVEQRRIATARMIDNAPALGIIGLIIYLDDQPAGFTIYEATKSKCAIWHAHKVLPQYANMDAFLTVEASRDLLNRGQIYANWEQDFGVASARQLKLTYHPVKYLKKYIVSI